MTREEQTIQAAKDFLPHITNTQLTLFAAGAVWADEHPKEELWNKDKVIEWLEDNLYDYIYINRFAGNVADWNTDLIKNLIKTMEE